MRPGIAAMSRIVFGFDLDIATFTDTSGIKRGKIAEFSSSEIAPEISLSIKASSVSGIVSDSLDGLWSSMQTEHSVEIPDLLWWMAQTFPLKSRFFQIE